MDEPLSLGNREEWRNWLKKNHSREDGIWLVISRKHSNALRILYIEALEEAICFGWIDGKMKRIDDEKFQLRFSPRKKDSPWSKLNRNRAERLIKNGRMTKAGLKTIDEAKKNGRWASAYSSKVKPAMPDDLRTALSSNEKALQNFNDLSNSHQLAYIYWMNEAKKPETRKRRMDEIVKRMKDSA